MGDLVLRRVLSREGLHKLSPMWEGPFKVVHVSRPGAARLEKQDRVQRLEHPAPPEVLPMKKGPTPVKKAQYL